MRKILLAIFLFSLTVAPNIGLAYSSNVCKTQGRSTCTETEVGPFMQDISKACGNLGDCTLADIMMVFNNVGNYILSIIGGIVLLMYVVGGFYMMSSAGNPERVKTGKKYITISTVGLLIVMFAWTGIYALESAIRYGTVYGTGGTGETYTSICTELTIGWECGSGVLETCTANQTCESACRQNHPGSVSDLEERSIKYHDCVNTGGTSTLLIDSSGGDVVSGYNRDSCATDQCPGNADWLCCEITLYY